MMMEKGRNSGILSLFFSLAGNGLQRDRWKKVAQQPQHSQQLQESYRSDKNLQMSEAIIFNLWGVPIGFGTPVNNLTIFGITIAFGEPDYKMLFGQFLSVVGFLVVIYYSLFGSSTPETRSCREEIAASSDECVAASIVTGSSIETIPIEDIAQTTAEQLKSPQKESTPVKAETPVKAATPSPVKIQTPLKTQTPVKVASPSPLKVQTPAKAETPVKVASPSPLKVQTPVKTQTPVKVSTPLAAPVATSPKPLDAHNHISDEYPAANENQSPNELEFDIAELDKMSEVVSTPPTTARKTRNRLAAGVDQEEFGTIMSPEGRRTSLRTRKQKTTQ